MRKNDYPTQHQYIVQACALRFDGYGYARTRAEFIADSWWLYDLAQQFVETQTLYADTLENWAAFFSLQRRLGRAMMIEADEECAFLALFLHLYQEPTPSGFIRDEDQRDWEKQQLLVEATAQWAREELKTLHR
jgi:hypothetical protein